MLSNIYDRLYFIQKDVKKVEDKLNLLEKLEEEQEGLKEKFIGKFRSINLKNLKKSLAKINPF